MAFCAWCGNYVQEVSYAPCPRCGNPSNGAQRAGGGSRSGSQAAGLIIGIVAGGLVLLAIIGILAAIAIPNLLTAKQRASQKRTMADLRSIGTALEAYATDNDNEFPAGSSVSDLQSALVPKYITALPTTDAWGTPLRYERLELGYVLGSAGADKTFERQSLREYTGGTRTDEFNADLVYSNGGFVQAPAEGDP